MSQDIITVSGCTYFWSEQQEAYVDALDAIREGSEFSHPKDETPEESLAKVIAQQSAREVNR